MESLIKEIAALKKEKEAVILAHYYVRDEVQAVADYIGDSYYLSKLATKVSENTLVFCGVSFMGESAKLLNPQKKVLMPDMAADCPMAHMADKDKIIKIKAENKGLAVVCYINSSAEIKAYADVCVTSSNAVKIIKNLDKDLIYFIPDENLGRFVASQVPEKKFIFGDGFCHVHTSISLSSLLQAKEVNPGAKILVHPECSLEILKEADYIGSTSGIIDYATKSKDKEFIICTEMGVFYELQQKNPDKRFYSVGHRQFCPNMKRINLEKIRHVLRTGENEIILEESLSEKANMPLKRMLELAE